MSKQIPSVFYFTDFMLIAYAVNQQKISEVRRFRLNPEGQTEFSHWLQASGIKPLYQPIFIVVDSRLEEYQIDTVPHVRGHNRQALLSHRLRRLYTHTGYTHATIIGRAKTLASQGKRVDDQALFLALNNAQALQPWIRLLLTQRISIQGIYSLPLVSQYFITELDLPDTILLVTHTEQVTANNPQGLRQSFFHKGRLQASRLIPLPIFSSASETQLAKKENYAAFVINEINKTVHYLSAHSLLETDKVLTVLLLSEPPQLLQVKKFVQQHPQTSVQFQYNLMAEVLAQHHLRHCPQPAYFHFLPLQQVARGKIPNHYAQAGDLFYSIHLKLRQKLYLSSMIIVLLALLTSASMAYQGWQNQQAYTDLQARIDYLQTQESQAKEKIGSEIAPRHMRNAVEAADKLRANRFKPHKALSMIGQELKNFPDLKLRRIKWTIREVENEQEKKLGQGSSDFNIKFLEIQRKSGKLTTRFEQVIEIEGQAWTLRDNLLQAQRTLDSFVKRLKQQQNIKLEIIKEPINKLDDAFQKDLGQDKNTSNAAFQLKLVFPALLQQATSEP